jgi:predicted AAA+ superfamily ATPase
MGIVSLCRSGRLEVWPDVLKPYMDDKAAPDLGPVVAGTAEKMYVDPEEFFARTHMTGAMEGLIDDVADTLAGKGGNSVFLLMSFFGGGKTHTMVALYHAFRNPAHLPEKLKAKVAEAGRPIIVVLDGSRREYLPTPNQPHVEGGFTIKTAWGMLAYRLGAYALVRDLDNEDSESPDVSKLEEILRQARQPVLILLDEATLYLHNLANAPALKGYAERFKVFLDMLARAVSNCKRVVLVASVHAERVITETGQEELLTEKTYSEGARDVYRILSRHASRFITPVPPGDIVKVLQKHIFKAIPEGEALSAKEGLYHTYREHRELFGAESDWELKLAAYSATPKETYPFHPKYVEVLFEFVTRSKTLQKTRDSVKITRKVVRRVLSGAFGDPDFIMPWHIGLDSPELLNMIMSGDFEAFRSIVQRDIISAEGKLGHVSECGKPELALKLATAILLKTYTYETHKVPLKTFPDLKEAALMVYEPSTFRQKGWQPVDIKSTLEEMPGKLRHFNDVDGRYWFDPYKSILDYVEGLANDLYNGPRQELYEKIAEKAEDILFEAKHAERAEHVFSENRVYVDYFTGPGVKVPDDPALKLIVVLRPEVKVDDLERLIYRDESGNKRTYRNTIAVLMPREERLEDMLMLAAKLKAADKAREEVKELYEEEEVRKLQLDRLKNYVQTVENRLHELLLSNLRVVAYPALDGNVEAVKQVETGEANSLVAQAEAGLTDTRTGPKLRKKFSFRELHEFLKRTLGWDLVDGQSAFELRRIVEVFYTNPIAPFTVRPAIEDVIKEGVGSQDIALKAKGNLYWKEIICDPPGARMPNGVGLTLPLKLSDDDEVLPYKIAARELREILLKDSKAEALPDRLVVRYYEVEFPGKRMRLEDLQNIQEWEDVLKTGKIHLHQYDVPRGFLINVTPSYLSVDEGEAPSVKLEVQAAGNYDCEVKLAASAGAVNPDSGKPPFSAVWQLPKLTKAGLFTFTVKGVGADGQSKEASVAVEVKSLEELKEFDKLDITHVGARLDGMTFTGLTPMLLVLNRLPSLGMKGTLTLDCKVGDFVAFKCTQADIEVVVPVLRAFASAANMLQNVKVSADGAVKFSQPEPLDEKKISALNTMAGHVKFLVLVRRK